MTAAGEGGWHAEGVLSDGARRAHDGHGWPRMDNGRRTPPPTEDGSASEEGGTRRCDDRGRQQRRGDGARRWVGGGDGTQPQRGEANGGAGERMDGVDGKAVAGVAAAASPPLPLPILPSRG